MHTQCPKCTAQYLVSAAELRQAHGQVKCGDCNTIFNALDFLAELKHSASYDSKTESLDDTNVEDTDYFAETNDSSESMQTTEHSQSTTNNNNEESTAGPAANDSKTTPAIHAAPSSQHYYPIEHVPDQPQNRTWLWAIAAAFLVSILVSQFVTWKWHSAEPYVIKVAAWVGWEIEPSLNNASDHSLLPDNIPSQELTNTNVKIYSQEIRRERNGQAILELSGSIVNYSDEPQTFPNLYVRMLNANGQPIAARVFNPTEYNISKFKTNEQLPQGIAAALKLEISQTTDNQGQPVSLDVRLLPTS